MTVALNGSTREFARHPLAGEVERFVEDLRVLTPPSGQAAEVVRVPDGRTNLVFRVVEGGSHGDLWVVGPRTRALFKSKTGVVRTVVLRFKPGWSVPLLGAAASAFTDRVVPLEEVWGTAARELSAELLAAKEQQAAMDIVCRAIAERAQKPWQTASAELARRAVRLLEAGELRVEGAADRLGVTGRHLRRAFTENIGIGPKDFARAVRLGRVLSMAKNSQNWTRIALDAGYCDQAHLIGDFRRLTGLTPRAYVERATRG